jgi:hypothetical protein
VSAGGSSQGSCGTKRFLVGTIRSARLKELSVKRN